MNETTITPEQEAQEQKVINDAAMATQRKRDQENQRRAKAAFRAHRITAIKHMVMHGTLWLIGCSTLIILAHIGDIAGWLMHIGTTAWSVVLGFQIGKVN